MAVEQTLSAVPATRTANPFIQSSQTVPWLQNGDQLTRTEFERRYDAMPQAIKAELIEGVVHMPSPVRVDHSGPHGRIMLWLGQYCTATPSADFLDNVSVRLDPDNEVQPDALLRLKQRGTSRIAEDGFVEGAPEFVVEIAASSASYDLREKKHAYRRNGVQEYVVWRVWDGAIDWFRLQEGDYVVVSPDASGVIRSTAFPGLWMNVAAFLADNLHLLTSTLGEGLASPEHTSFIAEE